MSSELLPEFELRFPYSFDQFLAAQQLAAGAGRDKRSWASFAIWLGLGIVLSFVWNRYSSASDRWIGLLITIGLVLAAFSIWQKIVGGGILRKVYEDCCKIADELVVRAFDDRIEIVSGACTTIWSWAGVKSIMEQGDHLYLLFSDRQGLVIPLNAFASQGHQLSFMNFARERIGEAETP